MTVTMMGITNYDPRGIFQAAFPLNSLVALHMQLMMRVPLLAPFWYKYLKHM